MLLAFSCAEAKYASTEQGPALSMPARFAEGDQVQSHSQTPSGGAPAVQVDESRGVREPQPGGEREQSASERSHFAPSALPDPEPKSYRDFMEYTFRYRRGEVSVVEAKPVSFDAARPAARRMGRWAVELWRGAELIERVRFDFPLLAAEPAPQDRHEEPIGLAAGAESEYTVLLPASPRVGRAVLVDRATGERLSLPWPVAR